MDTFQNLGAPNRARFGVFKLSKPKRLKSRHGLPDKVTDGNFVYRALSALEVDGSWGTWLGEQRSESGRRPVLLKHTGENNRTRAGADALWLEALLTLELDGPQVVPLLDYGVVEGRPFAVYGFEEGALLAQVIEGLKEQRERLPSGVAVGIILQACDLIRRLHDLALSEEQVGGFVHGSLCPRSFVLTERGDVKVMGLVGVRPVGRVVGREHVPAAAVPYAAPDLLAGAPVTPAVDVHSLAAVLQELLGDDDGQLDELGGIVREMLRAGSGGGFVTIEAFAGALQDAVRRTGVVVARQSIGAQVRGVCERYLLERRRQVRAQLEQEWPDELGGAGEEPAAEAVTGDDQPVPEEGVGASEEPASSEAAEPVAAELRLENYDEDADDAATRIYDPTAVDASEDKPGQPEAWMHDGGAQSANRSFLSRWAVLGMLGVLVAVASGAALMANRSIPREGAMGAQAALPAGGSLSAASHPGDPGRGAPATATAAVTTNAPQRPTSLAAVDPTPGGEAGAGAPPEGESSEPTDTGSEKSLEGGSKSGVEEGARSADSETAAGRRSRRSRTRKPAPSPAASADEEAAGGAPDRDEPSSEPAQVAPAPVAARKAATVKPAPTKPKVAATTGSGQAPDDDLVVEQEEGAVAYLTVTATPYATIFIDGQRKGVTPLVGLELSPGFHRMVARTEDGRTKGYTLQLEAGKTESVPLNLEE